MVAESSTIRLSEGGTDDATPKSLSHYKATVYLIAAIALTKFIGFLYVLYLGSDGEEWTIVAAPIVILFGLWLASNIIRYAGAIWLLIVSGLMASTLFNPGKIVFWPAVASIAVLIVLSVAACWQLVISKQFAAEFTYLRRTQPAYRTVLRKAVWVMVAGVVVVMAIATWNDIRPWIG